MLISVNMNYQGHLQRGSRWQIKQNLLYQKHHGVELNFILIHLSGYGGVHPQIKKFYQIINTKHKDGHLSSLQLHMC